MKVRSLATAFVLGMSVLVTGASNASAAPPIHVVIHIVPNQTGGPCRPFQCGHWDLTSSASNDDGTYKALGARVAPPERSPFSPGPLFEEFLLPSAHGNGSLIVKLEERIVGTFPNTTQLGVWEIEAQSGTGVYAGASGHGDVSFSNPPITLTLTGVISKI